MDVDINLCGGGGQSPITARFHNRSLAFMHACMYKYKDFVYGVILTQKLLTCHTVIRNQQYPSNESTYCTCLYPTIQICYIMLSIRHSVWLVESLIVTSSSLKKNGCNSDWSDRRSFLTVS